MRETPFGERYGTIINVKCKRGLMITVVEGIVGWAFALGLWYVVTVIAFSL